jgi:hypothetical protein
LSSRFYIAVVIAITTFISTSSFASKFKVGETVFVAFPAGNIKDDAFIVGKVTKIMPNGDYQLSVIDYVEGHDYGVSCVPMIKNDGTTGKGDDIWDMWTDTTKLKTEELDYVVSQKNVLKLGYGKTYFIERNNLYIVFGRWLSGAPMLNIDRINMAIKTAKLNNLEAMEPAFELAKMQRKGLYGKNGRPLYPFETIKPMLEAMQYVEQLFIDDPELAKLWRQRPRDWKTINADTRIYFLVQAIDFVYENAWNQVYEEGIERADPKDVEELLDYVKKFKR